MIEITVNGELQRVADDTSTANLIDNMGLTGKRIAVEINREIVPRSTFNSHILHAGDSIEIVQAIGGG